MSALRKQLAASHAARLTGDPSALTCPECGATVIPIRQATPFGTQSGQRKAIGIVFVVLIHAILLYFILRHQPTQNGVTAAQQGELVYMMPLPSLPAAKPAATPHKEKKHPPPSTAIHEKPVTPPVLTVPAPEAITPPTDMMSMINAARERRHSSDTAVAQDYAQEEDSNASASDFAAANIKRDLQNRLHAKAGTNGMFRILSKGVRTAQFSFRGWTTDARDNWRQTYEVDAGMNGDVERAIVRKMIEIIRQHYQGDFNWESHRLGRVQVMSARLADNQELEEFLLLEFFR